MIAGQERACVVQNAHDDGDVAHRCAVIDQRSALPLGIPGRDRRYTDFHLERRCDSVVGFEAIVLGRLAMRVEIDESGRDDQALHIDDGLAL